MGSVKPRVFVSYHHANDQSYKEGLVKFGEEHGIFTDASVDTGDIDDALDDQAIREKIRDEYLRDSSVTIVLVGLETKGRKHVDWEIYSSMYNGKVNKQSGILVVTLPALGDENYTVGHGEDEKALIYPDNQSWESVTERSEYERRYPYLPDRIVDNLLTKKANMSVVNWNRVNAASLRFLVEATYRDRVSSQYDLSRPMRRANS